MKLTVLGSGGSIPHPHRSSSGFWLETGSGSVLLDCSGAIPLRMAQENLDWPNLDAIWISHFHIDHCAGLLPFLAGVKHADKAKGRVKPLNIFGPVGIEKLLADFDGVNNYRLFEQPFPLKIIEVEPLEKFDILPGVEAVAMQTPHTDESHAIHLRDREGKTMVYSADTGFSEVIAAFATGVDLFVLECTFIRDKPVQKHLELAEAIFLIRKAHPKRSMLTHFYPEWDNVNFGDEVRKIDSTCDVIEAKDGLVIEF